MKHPEAPRQGGYRNAEPERAAAGTKGQGRRENLAEPWIEGEWLYATDSYVAVRIPVERDQGDTDGIVPGAALKASRKVRLPELRRVFLNGDVRTPSDDGTITMARPEADNLPAVEEFFGEPEGTAVALDVDKLLQVAKALGTREIVLTVTDNLKPLHVQPLNRSSDQRHGLVMPIRMPA